MKRKLLIIAMALLTSNGRASEASQECPYIGDKIHIAVKNVQVKSGQPIYITYHDDSEFYYYPYPHGNNEFTVFQAFCSEGKCLSRQRIYNTFQTMPVVKMQGDNTVNIGYLATTPGQHYISYQVYIPARECNVTAVGVIDVLA